MDQNAEILKNAISGSLKIIEQDREKEIISRRFGLNGNKETDPRLTYPKSDLCHQAKKNERTDQK